MIFFFSHLYYVSRTLSLSLSLSLLFYAFFISKTFAFHLDGFSSPLTQFTQTCAAVVVLIDLQTRGERNEIQIERKESENDFFERVSLALSLSLMNERYCTHAF
jgi:hypothetical protein